ncbi:MAG: hypothetical protein FJ145_13890 [Deltaproteobacteria bacterium]|nr:hypothetical protein [Deltaproteobacteria bacterium]
MKRPARMLKKALLFSALFFLAAAYFGLDAASAQTVQVKIGAILASNQNDDFDSRLAGIEKQLKVMKYRSYKLLKEESENVQGQANVTFSLPGGRSLVVSPQESKNNQHALKVNLKEGDKPVLDTTVRLNNGGNFILGGPPHEGGVLVLSIWATAQ